MSDELSIEERLIILRDIINVLEDPLKAISTLKWDPSNGFWTLILRSVLVRQYEALQAIVDLIRAERAHLCVPLLRPSVEEYLWVQFLQTLSDKDREDFILAKSTVEGYKTLRAQWNDAGSAIMIQLGFPANYLSVRKVTNDDATKKLVELATRLKWEVGRDKIPTTGFVAKKTGNETMYSLIYHATSRTVHFTTSELLRRTWGNAEGVTVNSKMMNGYWAAFSLYWAPRIFLLTFLGLIDEFERLSIDFELDDSMNDIMKRFLNLGKVAIVTPEELNLRPSQKW